MDVREKLQTLIETSNDILNVYHDHMGNKNISIQLRHVMADNIILLGNMISYANNLALFDQSEQEILYLSEELFSTFNECVIKNIKIFNHLFEPA